MGRMVKEISVIGSVIVRKGVGKGWHQTETAR